MGCSPTLKVDVKIDMRNNYEIDKLNNIKKDILIPQENDDPLLFYSIIEFIKHSKHSTVYKVKHIKSSEIRIMKIYEENSSNITKTDIKNQINILKTLSHPQIIKLYEVYYFSNKVYLIYEYCPDGNLFEYITKMGKLNENKTRQIIHQIITALNYCHLNKIILCNLSPEHIVVQNKTNKNSLWVKIIDFGAFNLIEKNNNNSKIKNNIISYGYKRVSNLCVIPPEDDLSEKTDIWSCGVIMYFLLSGDYPFKGKNSYEIKQEINNFNSRKINFEGEIWNEISIDGINFLKKLLELNPFNRPNTKVLLEDIWIKKYNDFNEKIYTSNAFKNAIKNAKNYQNKNQIKNWLMSFIIHNFIKIEDLDSLRKCFLILDKDADGKITKDDLLFALKKNMNDNEAENDSNLIINNIKSYDGNINYDDFIKSTMNIKDLLNDKNLTLIFKLIDKEKKGKVSKDDIKNFFCNHNNYNGNEDFYNFDGHDIFLDFVNKLDINGDGKLNLKEFKQLKKKL